MYLLRLAVMKGHSQTSPPVHNLAGKAPPYQTFSIREKVGGVAEIELEVEDERSSRQPIREIVLFRSCVCARTQEH